MGIWGSKKSIRITLHADDEIYELAYDEVSSGARRKGLWAKAIVLGEGDVEKTESRYLELLVQRIKEDKCEKMHEIDNAGRDGLVGSDDYNVWLCRRLRLGKRLSRDQYCYLARLAGARLEMPVAAMPLSSIYKVRCVSGDVVLKGNKELRDWLIFNIKY